MNILLLLFYSLGMSTLSWRRCFTLAKIDENNLHIESSSNMFISLLAIEYKDCTHRKFSFHELNCFNICPQYTGNLIFFCFRESKRPFAASRAIRLAISSFFKFDESRYKSFWTLNWFSRCYNVTLTDFTIVSCASSFKHCYSIIPTYIVFLGISMPLFTTYKISEFLAILPVNYLH